MLRIRSIRCSSILIKMACNTKQLDRHKCVLDPDVCTLLVRAHIKEVSDDYKVDDIEVVIGAYAGFLTAVSQHTVRLNASVVARSLIKVHKTNEKVALSFGETMAQCLGYINKKMRQSTSQKKLSDTVKSIIQIWNTSGPLARKLSGSDVVLPCEARAPKHASAPGSPDTTMTPVVSPTSIARLYGASAQAIAKAPDTAGPQLAQQLDEVLLVDSSQEHDRSQEDCS